MYHLIANSGLQFITPDPVELNFSEPFVFENGKTLKYSFLEIKDFLTEELTFDLAYYHSGSQSYIPLSELVDGDAVEKSENGREKLDESGMPKMLATASPSIYSSYSQGSPEIININSLEGFMIKNEHTGDHEPAYKRLIGKWLPMPMFEREVDGVTAYGPVAWCRVKIVDEGECGHDKHRYRFVWAFDTKTSELPSDLRPCFLDGDGASKDFCLCNRVEQLVPFMSFSSDSSAFSDYVRSIFDIELGKPEQGKHMYKYIAYYIYFINFLRVNGVAPEIKLYGCEDEKDYIDVDLVLDIGNSRTCGILFERGIFTERDLLELRDMSEPWNVYNNSFDMRLVFRKADFGNDIVLVEEDMFNWPSLVRVGEEARKLVYNAREDSGESELTTNYSSPKRYLWDNKPFDGKWEFLRMNSDPANVRTSENIYIPKLSDMFDKTGRYYHEGETIPADDFLNPVRYSRSSLMTFVMIEIFLQVTSQINSHKYRTIRGEIDRKRILRHIILTCPTAMPIAEQIRLRQAAEEAYDALKRCITVTRPAIIVPSAKSLAVADNDDGPVQRQWSFDEASCCQLVYLYAEIAQRYRGEIHRFVNLKGHVRPEDIDKDGNGTPSLTICSIDVGAGTTDIMINNYKYDTKGSSRITPTPIFWDSYYLAGDEILRKVIQNQILEGRDNDLPDLGSITSALSCRLRNMSDDQLRALPCMNHPIQGTAHRARLDSIVRSIDKETRDSYASQLAVDLMHDYFGENSQGMTSIDKRCRIDFVTQIAHPMAQFFLELQRSHYPSRVYTYDDLIAEDKCFKKTAPSSYLLNHFENHFGFRFEELRWRFDPESVADDIRSSMETLMKTLADVVYAYRCDILVLAGRPTSLDPLTELFVKYIPISPHRLIRLNDYHVGEWYPFTYGNGLIYDQKTVVAVGGMIGYLASHTDTGFSASSTRNTDQQHIILDFSKIIKLMKSTALFMAELKPKPQLLKKPIFITPSKSMARITLESKKPYYIGCSQFESVSYQARPIYSLSLIDGNCAMPVTVSINRNFHDNREELYVESVTDANGNEIAASSVELIQQSLVDGDGGEYWLDTGCFELQGNN